MCAFLIYAQPSLAAQLPYSVDKIRQAAQHMPQHFVMLSAHRGYWRNAPENSAEAIDAAIAQNYESIEVDVRLSWDRTPWLFHDATLEHVTDGTGYISDATDAYLGGLLLKDRQGQKTNDHPLSVRDALNILADNQWTDSNGVLRGFVLVLDCKAGVSSDPGGPSVSGYEALKASWRILNEVARARNRADLSRAVIFKMKAKEFPAPSQLESDLGIDAKNSQHFYLEAVLQPDDSRAAEVFTTYNTEYYLSRYMVGFEPNPAYVDQPVSMAWLKALKQAGQTVPGFPSWNEFPEGVVYSSGICCLERNTDPSKPNLDYNGSAEYWLQIGANWLTTDNPDFLNTYLRNIGMRDTHVLE